ncbi:MAG TPA: UDP-galactose-lipid carrier transferase [Acidimicrobiales bacterium]|jgi:polyphosphate kinase 2 (PPK2 family)|nr:UDP-galactose-lipid carrier transferase [Acidimicrobiales bacterium]
MSRVDDIDLTKSMSKEESDKRVRKAQKRLTQLRLFSAGLLEPKVTGPGLVVLFEGFDAAGKGGAIRRLTASLDPRHVLVHPVGPPTEEELRHHFLWRFQEVLPGTGEMTVFDRSWYGRLLVERVEGLINERAAERSAKEIVQFEHMLTNDGTTIVKFWLQISDKEQLKRFEERQNNPLKRWKLTPDDWRNREKRDAYLKALRYMVDTTDEKHSHWELIPAENKHYARVAVLETLIERWVQDLERHGHEVPASTGGDFLN